MRRGVGGRGQGGKAVGDGRGGRGFSLIELLIGVTLLSVALLAIASMFSMGYGDVVSGGKTTMAAAAARQIIEDARAIPFDNLTNLNGLDTQNPASLPANDPERAVARKWRYALAGEGGGWTFTTAEKNQWRTISALGQSFGGRGQLTVTSPSATLRLVAVTITPRGQGVSVQLATVISRL